MRKIWFIFFAVTISLLVPVVCAATPWRLITVYHVVQEDDSLNSIAVHYMFRNTYGLRRLEEFKEGIRQLNNMRYGEEVVAGQSLRINYWVRAEDTDEY